MSHRLERPAPKARLQILLPALALFLTLSWWFLFIAAGPAITAEAPGGLVSFQLAGSVAKASAIVASWDQEARLWMAFGLGIDYLYIMAYAVTFSIGCIWAAGAMRSAAMAWVGVGLAWGVWLGGVADATENLALFKELLGPVAAPWPQVAYWAAWIKMVFFLAPLVYIALGALGRGLAPRTRG